MFLVIWVTLALSLFSYSVTMCQVLKPLICVCRRRRYYNLYQSFIDSPPQPLHKSRWCQHQKLLCTANVVQKEFTGLCLLNVQLFVSEGVDAFCDVSASVKFTSHLSVTRVCCPWVDAVDEFNWKSSLTLLLIQYSRVVYSKYCTFQARCAFNNRKGMI